MEINAGAWYLRALRDDERLSDVPVLVDAFADPAFQRWGVPGLAATAGSAARYVARRAQQWERDERWSWAIADPVTGALRGEIGIKDLYPRAGTGELAVFTVPGARGTGVMRAVVPVVLRYAFGAPEHGGLGMHRIAYRHADDNTASEALARSAGFTFEGRERGAHLCDGERRDGLLWARLATDR